MTISLLSDSDVRLSSNHKFYWKRSGDREAGEEASCQCVCVMVAVTGRLSVNLSRREQPFRWRKEQLILVWPSSYSVNFYWHGELPVMMLLCGETLMSRIWSNSLTENFWWHCDDIIRCPEKHLCLNREEKEWILQRACSQVILVSDEKNIVFPSQFCCTLYTMPSIGGRWLFSCFGQTSLCPSQNIPQACDHSDIEWWKDHSPIDDNFPALDRMEKLILSPVMNLHHCEPVVYRQAEWWSRRHCIRHYSLVPRRSTCVGARVNYSFNPNWRSLHYTPSDILVAQPGNMCVVVGLPSPLSLSVGCDDLFVSRLEGKRKLNKSDICVWCVYSVLWPCVIGVAVCALGKLMCDIPPSQGGNSLY